MKPGDIIEYSTRSGSTSRAEVVKVYQWGDHVLIDTYRHNPGGRCSWTVRLDNILSLRVVPK